MSARQKDVQSNHPSTALHLAQSGRQTATLGIQWERQHWLFFHHSAAVCRLIAAPCPLPVCQETPMNFVDPKEYNYPGLVRKNRYKTILPSE